MNPSPIYLDHSATTPPHPRVLAVIDEVRRDLPWNPGSIHQPGQRARVRLESDREVIAAAFAAEPREIIFTSGGTEANNLALKGSAFRIRRESGEWPTLVTARTEHHAVLHPVEWLASLGAPLRHVEVDRHARVDPSELACLLAEIDSPALVSLMHVNNEVGTINPILEIAEVVRARGGLLHTDAVQSCGKLDLVPVAEAAAMISVAPHKFGGPRGVGALYADREYEIDPLIHGGSQERDRRGGTEPVDLIAGFAEAIRIAGEERNARMARLVELHAHLRDALAEINGIRFNTPDENGLPTILNISFEDADKIDGEALLVGMDIRGVALSNGSACTSGSIQPSHVLTAMGHDSDVASTALRFSLGWETTCEEIDRAVVALREVLDVMRDAVGA